MAEANLTPSRPKDYVEPEIVSEEEINMLSLLNFGKPTKDEETGRVSF